MVVFILANDESKEVRGISLRLSRAATIISMWSTADVANVSSMWDYLNNPKVTPQLLSYKEYSRWEWVVSGIIIIKKIKIIPVLIYYLE